MTGSDKVVIEAYDDPQVDGVTCYVSRARTGGIKGQLGMAEDPPEASIACRQVGTIAFKGPIRQQDNVFSERMSMLFKALHVVRAVDRKRNTLVYLTYSDRIVSGSPQNSVTAVRLSWQVGRWTWTSAAVARVAGAGVWTAAGARNWETAIISPPARWRRWPARQRPFIRAGCGSQVP